MNQLKVGIIIFQVFLPKTALDSYTLQVKFQAWGKIPIDTTNQSSSSSKFQTSIIPLGDHRGAPRQPSATFQPWGRKLPAISARAVTLKKSISYRGAKGSHRRLSSTSTPAPGEILKQKWNWESTAVPDDDLLNIMMVLAVVKAVKYMLWTHVYTVNNKMYLQGDQEPIGASSIIHHPSSFI